MGINWDLYNKRLNINGTTKRERDMQSFQNVLTNQLPDSLSYKPVTINGVAGWLELVKTAKDHVKIIHSIPSQTFDCGDYVVFRNKTYLIDEVDNDDEIYSSGKMTQSNYTLKFQATDGTILSYPCIDSNTLGDEEENKTITVGDGIKKIKIPFNSNTILIRPEKRFFIDRHPTSPVPYRVINCNTTEFSYGDNGLIELTLQQDVLKESDVDRVDLWICDYFEPVVFPPTPVGIDYSIITYLGDCELRIGASNKTFTCNAFDSLGNAIVIDPIWTVTTLPEFEEYVHYVPINNVIRISTDEVDEMLNSKIKLEVQDNLGNYYSSIMVDVVSGV